MEKERIKEAIAKMEKGLNNPQIGEAQKDSLRKKIASLKGQIKEVEPKAKAEVKVIKKKIEKWMINPMVILFLLGILQALLGWIMVASGLNDENLYVDHIRLAIHFSAALGLLCYTVWFALMLLVPNEERVVAPQLKKQTNLLLGLLGVQLIFGAFMAGLKAANFATTWPLINGEFIPSSLSKDTWMNFTHDPLALHFIHRNLAYVLAILIFLWYKKTMQMNGGNYFSTWRRIPFLLVLVQVEYVICLKWQRLLHRQLSLSMKLMQ
jgi:cytochrome c oxidase assembly protein subunit 15